MKPKRVLLDSELAPIVQELFQAAKIEADVITPRNGLLEPLVEHGDYAALLLQSKTSVPLSVLEAAGKSLKVIGIVGDSLANINVADASRKGILVKVTEYVNAFEAANLTLRLMVTLLSRTFRQRDADGARIIADAQEFLSGDTTGFELAGATVGLIGCGRVAQSLAMEIEPYCERIIGYDNHFRTVYETFHQRSPLERPVIEYGQLNEVLEHSDIISIHTAGDERVFKGDELYYAKKRPFIVNTSRGGSVDEDALLAALREKRVRGAAMTVPAAQIKKSGLDDWTEPFLKLRNVIIAPATGKSTSDIKKKSVRRLAQSVIDFLVDKDVSLAVNPMGVVSVSREERYPMSRGELRGSIPIFLGQ